MSRKNNSQTERDRLLGRQQRATLYGRTYRQVLGVVAIAGLIILLVFGYRFMTRSNTVTTTAKTQSTILPSDGGALLKGLNYDIRQGADWDPEKCKNASSITNDLTVVSTITKSIRIYSLSDCDVAPVLTAAKSLNLTVWLGVWVTSDRSVYEREVKALQVLIDAGLIDDNVIGFNVGSEAVYRKDLTPAQAVDYLNEFKDYMLSRNLTNKLYSITDIVDVLSIHPEMVEAGDVVTANQFSFWDKVPIETAGPILKKRMQPLIDVAKKYNKPVIISETGWATQGIDPLNRCSEPSPESAVSFLTQFHKLAEELDWNYYYFCAFDTPYKIVQTQIPNSVEAYFGIFNYNGTMKDAFIQAGYEHKAE